MLFRSEVDILERGSFGREVVLGGDGPPEPGVQRLNRKAQDSSDLQITVLERDELLAVLLPPITSRRIGSDVPGLRQA